MFPLVRRQVETYMLVIYKITNIFFISVNLLDICVIMWLLLVLGIMICFTIPNETKIDRKPTDVHVKPQIFCYSISTRLLWECSL